MTSLRMRFSRRVLPLVAGMAAVAALFIGGSAAKPASADGFGFGGPEVIAAPKPDLAATYMSLSLHDDGVHVLVWLQNQGTAASPGFWAKVTAPGSAVTSWKWIGGLGAGQSTYFSLVSPYSNQSCTQTFTRTVMLDATNLVNELTEGNNFKSATVVSPVAC